MIEDESQAKKNDWDFTSWRCFEENLSFKTFDAHLMHGKQSNSSISILQVQSSLSNSFLLNGPHLGMDRWQFG